MRNELIEAVMKYYSIDYKKAIQIIYLRQACGEFDELIRELREEEEEYV